MSSNDGVYRGDMDPLTPEQLDAALADATDASPGDHVVERFLSDASAALRSVEAPTPDTDLSEFLGVSTSPATLGPTTEFVVGAPVHVEAAAWAPPRTSAMFTSLAAFAATTGGKILVGAAAVLGLAGGAQASGVVDLIPDTSDAQTILVAAQPPGDEVAAPDEVLGEFRVPADEAGSVVLVVRSGSITADAVSFGAGWTAEVDRATGDSIEVVFRNDAGELIEIEAKLIAGVVKVEVFDSTTGIQAVSFFDPAGDPIAPPPGLADDGDDSVDGDGGDDGGDDAGDDDDDDDDDGDGDDDNDDDDAGDDDDADDGDDAGDDADDDDADDDDADDRSGNSGSGSVNSGPGNVDDDNADDDDAGDDDDDDDDDDDSDDDDSDDD